jgi:hypothetical protein
VVRSATFGDLVEAPLVPGNQDEMRPLSREAQRVGAPDPGRGSGDERAFSPGPFAL